MESQSSFIWTYGAIELYSISDVYMHCPQVVNPWNAEGQDALWFNNSFDEFCLFKFWMLVVNIFYRNKHFFYSLQIFCLSWMFLDRKSTRLNSSHQIISYAVF